MEFRFIFHTERYDETRAFFRDLLELEVVDEWDHEPTRRGTVFAVNGGMIEVMSPRAPGTHPVPGGRVLIEVDDVDAVHDRLNTLQIASLEPPRDEVWGHRLLVLKDPNGLEIALFTKISA